MVTELRTYSVKYVEELTNRIKQLEQRLFSQKCDADEQDYHNDNMQRRIKKLETALKEIDAFCPYSSESQIAVKALAAVAEAHNNLVMAQHNNLVDALAAVEELPVCDLCGQTPPSHDFWCNIPSTGESE